MKTNNYRYVIALFACLLLLRQGVGQEPSVKKYADLYASEKAVSSLIESTEKSIQEMETQLASVQENLRAQKKALAEAESKKAELEKEIDELNQRKDTLEENIATTQSELAQKRTALAAVNERVEILLTTGEELATRFDQLLEDIKDYKKAAIGLKAEKRRLEFNLSGTPKLYECAVHSPSHPDVEPFIKTAGTQTIAERLAMKACLEAGYSDCKVLRSGEPQEVLDAREEGIAEATRRLKLIDLVYLPENEEELAVTREKLKSVLGRSADEEKILLVEQKEVETAEKQLSDLKIQLSQCQEQIPQSSAALSATESTRYELSGSCESIAAQITSLEESLETHRTQLSTAKEEKAQLVTAIADAETKATKAGETVGEPIGERLGNAMAETDATRDANSGTEPGAALAAKEKIAVQTAEAYEATMALAKGEEPKGYEELAKQAEDDLKNWTQEVIFPKVYNRMRSRTLSQSPKNVESVQLKDTTIPKSSQPLAILTAMPESTREYEARSAEAKDLVQKKDRYRAPEIKTQGLWKKSYELPEFSDDDFTSHFTPAAYDVAHLTDLFTEAQRSAMVGAFNRTYESNYQKVFSTLYEKNFQSAYDTEFKVPDEAAIARGTSVALQEKARVAALSSKWNIESQVTTTAKEKFDKDKKELILLSVGGIDTRSRNGFPNLRNELVIAGDELLVDVTVNNHSERTVPAGSLQMEILDASGTSVTGPKSVSLPEIPAETALRIENVFTLPIQHSRKFSAKLRVSADVGERKALVLAEETLNKTPKGITHLFALADKLSTNAVDIYDEHSHVLKLPVKEDLEELARALDPHTLSLSSPDTREKFDMSLATWENEDDGLVLHVPFRPTVRSGSNIKSRFMIAFSGANEEGLETFTAILPIEKDPRFVFCGGGATPYSADDWSRRCLKDQYSNEFSAEGLQWGRSSALHVAHYFEREPTQEATYEIRIRQDTLPPGTSASYTASKWTTPTIPNRGSFHRFSTEIRLSDREAFQQATGKFYPIIFEAKVNGIITGEIVVRVRF